PEEFSRLIARFYGAAAGVIDEWDGIVDKFVGDSAVALFIPGFAGSDHAANAIAAARGILERTGNDGPEPWIPIGAGIHTGRSFVGTVGEGDARDFTALGDTVNMAARLTGIAGAGEILISAEAAAAGGLETTGLERRTPELRGRDQSVEAWVARARDVSLRSAVAE
ncbi:MAG: adenylate/guanylate cyclase domain-containing protein, partial [Gaiellaceae bacterium]